jgi:hypothetical protein
MTQQQRCPTNKFPMGKAVPSHFAKTKTKLSFAFVLASFATTVPSLLPKLNLSRRNT